jgi:hypothetical protein
VSGRAEHIPGARWLSLSEWVGRLRAHAERIRLPSDPVTAATMVAMAANPNLRKETLGLVNVAQLALAMGDRPLLHQIRPAAARLVHETDLHSLPDEPPRLLRRAWLVEVRRPETGEVLWGDTAALGGYELDGLHTLVGFEYPDGLLIGRWRPSWSGEDLDAGVSRGSSPMLDDVDAFYEWSREAARFAVVLGLLLDAEGVPFRINVERPGGARDRSAAGGKRSVSAWTLRHIYLDEVRVSRSVDAPSGGEADLDHRLPEQVMVRGHLKRQRYGARRSQVRWIYVASYEARRWVAPRSVRVVVATRSE